MSAAALRFSCFIQNLLCLCLNEDRSLCVLGAGSLLFFGFGDSEIDDSSEIIPCDLTICFDNTRKVPTEGF